MEEPADEALIERYRAAGGSPKADSLVNQLFQRYHGRVAAWCYRMTGDVDSAADLAQEVLLKAFQNLHAFRGESKFSTWLYSITRNRCLDAMRSRAMVLEETTDDILDNMADPVAEPVSTTLERRESEKLVRKLMQETLDDTESKVMTLHYMHELPLSSVTRMLGLTNQSGAKAYIVSARRKLDRALQQWRSREPGGTGRRHAG